jgi:hypothetical protein
MVLLFRLSFHILIQHKETNIQSEGKVKILYWLNIDLQDLFTLAINRITFFESKRPCGNIPQQRINTESVAMKLTHVPTATDRHRIKQEL